ncbi:MAG TPA: histidine--tRNA ligase [Candidatus Acidoferrales bacterium]|nr:histidine--tRNA ligase [Candidatus Acidoferrales bacterium]
MTEAAKPESERRKFRAIKGTRDILPPDSALWNWFEKTARSVMESFNFGEIRTPIFEETELFARAIGADTDVVAKEVFTLQARPESVQRAELLREAIHRIGDVKHELRVTRLLQHLTVFVRYLQIALQQGHLPKDAANLHNVGLLERGLKEAGQLWKSGSTQPESYWNGLFEKVKRIADDIRFESAERTSGVSELDLEPTASLRPEATASVVRAYVEHRLDTRPGDQKLYYIGPMFRRERPQKGRYRQFYQIGAEVLGTSDAPAIDAELIEMLTVLLERCQIEKYTLLINSIGCADCRPKYVELLRAELRKPEIFERLGADSKRRVETNPLRVMDSKLPEEQEIIDTKLPKISEHLCADCKTHYEKLKKELRLRAVPFTESPRLVRGLDYYMRTTFEITSPILGAQNALCGGGRYDGLVELLGGPKGIKGIGFALGEDRFIDAIQEARLGEQATKIHAVRPVDVFVAWMGERAYPTAVRLARVLRGEKHAVELPPEELKFRKALERADKMGARYVLIIGDDEIASGQLTVKRLADGKQEKIAEEAVVDYFRGAR